MTMTIDPKHEAVLHKMMDDIDNVTVGKVLGMPRYKVNGKMAVGLFTKTRPRRPKLLLPYV